MPQYNIGILYDKSNPFNMGHKFNCNTPYVKNGYFGKTKIYPGPIYGADVLFSTTASLGPCYCSAWGFFNDTALSSGNPTVWKYMASFSDFLGMMGVEWFASSEFLPRGIAFFSTPIGDNISIYLKAEIRLNSSTASVFDTFTRKFFLNDYWRQAGYSQCSALAVHERPDTSYSVTKRYIDIYGGISILSDLEE